MSLGTRRTPCSQANRMAEITELTVPDFSEKRKRVLTQSSRPAFTNEGSVVLYWMSRDQRVQDNWALIFAQKLAVKYSAPLMVCFCLVPKFLSATIRQYGFLLKGLKEVEQTLSALRIPFHLLLGAPGEKLPSFVSKHSVSAVICDFAPLRVPTEWTQSVAREMDKLNIPLVQVDAHNIIPCWLASPRQEYAARTIRPKIHALLPEFLVDFPLVVPHPHPPKAFTFEEVDWTGATASLEVDRTVEEVSWAVPGTAAGLQVLEDFCKKRLKLFGSSRNDPNVDALSHLSPWIHFGQVSAQRCALRVKQCKSSTLKPSVDSFIEEAVVRRELAENFCFYNRSYDRLEGAPSWAQETLRAHAKDVREYVYSEEELEKAQTHDNLWNAMQLQMVREGKMHGYLRMYWAKKILEWSPSPEEALRVAIQLNDKYELDGRDPNGYVGCMWSVCGVHDQGWKERPVFGKIRYMNYEGCKRKFDVEGFVAKYCSRKRPSSSTSMGNKPKKAKY